MKASADEETTVTPFRGTIEKLVTEEDAGWVHKILGGLALISYAWRFYHAGKIHDMGFASYPEWTAPTLMLHWALSVSSFAFAIPRRRIATDGGRIWPEYRWHSAIFTTRSLACIALNACRRQENHGGYCTDSKTYHICQLVIVLVCMLAADLASYHAGPYHSKSIRDLAGPAWVKYFFSVMQFLATAVHLVGFTRSSLYFYIALVIQVTAFLMTLRRRHVVSHGCNLVLYSLLLLGGFLTGVYECYVATQTNDTTHSLSWLTMVGWVACTAALWRMGPWKTFRNKYIIWTVVHLGLENAIRPGLQGDVAYPGVLSSHSDVLIGCTMVMAILVILNGVYKVQWCGKVMKNKAVR